MRLNRFYIERLNLRVGSSVKLNDSDVKHIRKVLRMQKGDNIIIFNGEKEFLAVLKVVSNEAVMAELTELLKNEDFSMEDRVEITLFQSLLRAGKYDFIIEKATELGVDNIVPLEAEFSQSKKIDAERKLERWKKVVIAAAQQSERVSVPEIIPPITFKDLAELKSNFDKLYLCTISREKIVSSLNAKDIHELSGIDKKEIKKVGFIIGPEGGFSPSEHEFASKLGIEFIKWNNMVLRSETAAISILAVFQFIFNS